LTNVSKLFLPQSTLEEWALAEKADVREGKLSFGEDGIGFPVVPAVHFLKLVTGTDDQKLLARVKTEEQLQALGGEQMADSVLLGETAYEVVPGYVAMVGGPGDAPPKADKDPKEEELLAAFFLNKL
jgi:hypothetical protein